LYGESSASAIVVPEIQPGSSYIMNDQI